MSHPAPFQDAQLPLAAELAAGDLRTALFCHLQSRWYLGELLCHASWVAALADAGIQVSVCTNRHYLELFRNHPAVNALHPPEEFTPQLAARHDLVVLTTTHPPTDYRDEIPLAIHAWNTGIALTRHGHIEYKQAIHDTNHFNATTHRHGYTALPDGRYLTLHLTDREQQTGQRALQRLLGDTRDPVTILNPSSSNSHTRESERPKAVDNLLDTGDYETLVHRLLRELPDHRILIGAPLKPGDQANHDAAGALAHRFADNPRVACLNDLTTLGEGLTMRAFAAVLAQPSVRHMVGNSTGSNTHLAATLNLPAVSIERSADEDIRDNWRDPARCQMGSFQWRNNHPSAASYRLPWNHRTPRGDDDPARHHHEQRDHCQAIAQLTRWHTELREHGPQTPWLPTGLHVTKAATAIADPHQSHGGFLTWQHHVKTVATSLTPEQRALYLDFHDEADYLHTTGAPRPASLMDYLTTLTHPTTHTAPSHIALTDPERHTIHTLTSTSNFAKLTATLARRVQQPVYPE
ncbi:hypothetical protein ACFVVX_34495 [Kitasatospora sp. NPDC058170]|uniref:hypothetical protein n=1 Tax=Kitasatospora sp. NPDC058170 TaxID=3346364 RepID=UPI0036D7FBA0